MKSKNDGINVFLHFGHSSYEECGLKFQYDDAKKYHRCHSSYEECGLKSMAQYLILIPYKVTPRMRSVD